MMNDTIEKLTAQVGSYLKRSATDRPNVRVTVGRPGKIGRAHF